jgi:hypothetical protein
MLEYRQTYAMARWCEHYGIALPDYLVAARLTHDEAAELGAWMSFSLSLMERLRVPFDTAATTYTAGDATALPTLCALGAVRDLLAEAWHPPTLKGRSEGNGIEWERALRVLDVGDVILAEKLLPIVTRGTTRLEPAWFAAVLSLSGVKIKWQTPADQLAMDERLPVYP